MKQNIYDNPEFFNSYQAKRNKGEGVNEQLEQPAMIAMLPDVKGMDVLDLGCGAGDLCRMIQHRGAASVTGIDISSKMIGLASKDAPQGVVFAVSSIEDYDTRGKAFDLVVSSLAFHYVEDLPGLFKRVSSYLKPGGILLFSMEHPVITCADQPGWCKDGSGKKLHWKVDAYEEEGKRSTFWIVNGVIKYHRKLATILNSLIAAGFTILEVQEPVAPDPAAKKYPDLAEERCRPPFLLVKARKA